MSLVYSAGGAMPLPKLAWDFNGTTEPYIGSATGTTTGSVSYSAGKYIQAVNIVNTPTGTPNTGTKYITWTNYGTFNPSVGVTVCFWINVNALPASGQQSIPLWMRGSAVNSAVYISLTPTNWGAVYTDGTNYYGPTSSAPLSTGVWYHLTVVVGAGTVIGYQNGVQIASPVAFSNPLDVSGFLYLGGNGNYGPASAIYDDLRIFDRPLTSSQVQAIYKQQGVPGRGAVTSNSRKIYVAPTGTYPSYTPTSGAQFPVFNTSNVSFYSSGGTSGGTVGQYLAFSSQTFNMSSGFSAVCQFAWTNGIGVWERILDFGIGTNNNNILLTRTGTSTNLLFSYRIGGTEYYVTAFGSIPAQNTLYTVVAIYDPSKPLLSLYVNGTLTSSIPAVVALDTRTLTQTYVGRSNWGSDAYSNVNINYLSIYNRVLTPDEIATPLPTPQITLKGTPLFNQLSQAARSSAVGAFSLRAVNGTSARAVNVAPGGTFPPSAMTQTGTNSSTQTLGTGKLNGSYTASSSSSAYGTEPACAFRLFDNGGYAPYIWQVSTYPVGGGTVSTPTTTTTGATNYNGEWLQFQTPFPINLTSYSAYMGFLSSFVLLGSTTGAASSWTLIDSQSGIVSTAVTKTGLNFVGYSYFRFVIITSTQAYPLISNVRFFGTVPSLATDFYADRLGNLLTAPVTGQSLAKWLGGATGYVTTWYNQIQSGQDVSATVAANQPTIDPVNKTIVFNGSTHSFSNTATTGGLLAACVGTGTKYTYTASWNKAAGSGTGRICEHNSLTFTGNQASALIAFGTVYGFNGESNDAHYIAPLTLGTQVSTVMRLDNTNSTNLRVRSNGTNYSGSTGNYATLSLNNFWFVIGRKASSNNEFFNGTMKNIMVFKDAISDADTALLDTWQQSI